MNSTGQKQSLPMPEWVLKLARRILALPPGRYMIVLTVGERHDWTVIEAGKVESGG